MGTPDIRLVLCTIGSAEEAAQLARTLVDRRLAACVNLVGPIRSIYRWQGAIDEAEEHLLLIKTRADRYAELRDTLADEHPYDEPEILALPVDTGAAGYLEWVLASTAAP